MNAETRQYITVTIADALATARADLDRAERILGDHEYRTARGRGTVAEVAERELDHALPRFDKPTPAEAARAHLHPILPLGAVLCVVDVFGCVPIDAASTPDDERERSFGDYTPDRFMIFTRNVRRLPTPFPCRGSQGLFDIQGISLEALA